MLNEPPDADPHVRWCGRGRGEPGPYPILSLSLCSRFSEPQSGSNPGLLAGSRHAFERGICLALTPLGSQLLERRRLCPSPVVAFEEAPSRVPSRGGARSPERRGFSHAGSRCSHSFAVLGKAGPDSFPRDQPATLPAEGLDLRGLLGKNLRSLRRSPFLLSAGGRCPDPAQLGRAPHNPWSSSEEAPSRAYFPRAGVVGPKRRGLVPNPGPRRSLCLSSRLAGVCSSVMCPSPTGLWRSRSPRRVLQYAPVVVPAERRDPIFDPGSRRSLFGGAR